MTIREQIAAWPAVSSDNVFPDYEAMARHWEDRTDAAEARLATATEALRTLADAVDLEDKQHSIYYCETEDARTDARAVLDALDKEGK